MGVGGVVALLVLWLWARYGRRPYVVINKSDATEAIASELGHIAGALERSATPRESRPPRRRKAPAPRELDVYVPRLTTSC